MEFNELIEGFAASLGIEGVEIDGGAAAFEIDGMRVNIFHDDPRRLYRGSRRTL